MDLDEAEQWINSSSGNEIPKGISSDHPSYSNFGSQPGPQKWEGSSIFDYNIGIEPSFPEFNQAPRNPNEGSKIAGPSRGVLDWDPRAMLSNLSFLEEKIHQLQNLVHIIVGRNGQMIGQTDDLVAQQQQQLVTADVTSIIAQLISTAGSLLPSVGPASNNGQPCEVEVESEPPQRSSKAVAEEVNHRDLAAAHRLAEQQNHFEEHEMKDEEDVEDGESLVPGSYEILQLEKEEILAPHTHFCAICGKGFKRDANLRMHMRGHGDEYKTAAALAKPHKESGLEPMVTKRYSCPYAGCKRNKEHKKFQPLKTILCVKNHYKRTHCDKSFTCSRCKTKKFSVIADLKTHEKHCGKDKWLCSCGTTFSRKDKLFGHISLFQGHTPAIPIDEGKSSIGLTDNAMVIEATNNGSLSSMNFGFGMSSDDTADQNVVDVKESLDDPTAYFSPINFDTCNFGGFHEFPRPSYEDSENSFSFLLSESCNYSQKSSNI